MIEHNERSGALATEGFRLRAIVRRRLRPMLLALLGVLIATVAAALLWPARFVSTGVILIEQQEVPVDLVRSTISSYADQRIQVISQRVMTTDNLLGIVQRFDLYPKERRKYGRETIIELIRKDIDFRTISADVIDPVQGRPTRATIAFSLGYASRSPDVAARVANELSSLYLEENLASRRQLAANAADFLSSEADKLSTSIAELERHLAEFKQRHLNDLPELAQVNMQLLSRADDDRRDVDTQLRALEQQIVYLQAQLLQLNPTAQILSSTGERIMSPSDRLKALRSEYARVGALYSPEHPDVIRVKREMDGLAISVAAPGDMNERSRQLWSAQSELTALRQRYSADHPDVLRMERQVRELASSQPPAPHVGNVEQPDNPAYIQIQAQLEAAVNERAALLGKRSSLNVRRAELEQRMTNTPGVERDYTSLMRELDTAQLKYREVREKQMEAQLAQNLESERKGERFTLIEPPLAPEEPTSPNRPLIVVLGLMLALLAAAAVAGLLEGIDGTVRDRDDLLKVLGVAPLAVLPRLSTSADQLRLSAQRRYAIAGAAATLTVSLALMHWYFRPLDVLWATAVRRMLGG